MDHPSSLATETLLETIQEKSMPRADPAVDHSESSVKNAPLAEVQELPIPLPEPMHCEITWHHISTATTKISWEVVDGAFVWPGAETKTIQFVRYLKRFVKQEACKILEIPYTPEVWKELEKTLQNFGSGPGLSLWRSADLVHLDSKRVTVEDGNLIVLELKRF